MGADVGGDALESHDGAGAGFFGDAGLGGVHDVHYYAAFEHLGEAGFDGEGGGLGGGGGGGGGGKVRGGAVGGGGGGGGAVVVDCHCEWVCGKTGFVNLEAL